MSWISDDDGSILSLRCGFRNLLEEPCGHVLYFAAQGARTEDITKAIEQHNQRAHQIAGLGAAQAKEALCTTKA
jgi:hypothetical protein